MANRQRHRRQRSPHESLGILIGFAIFVVFIASFWQVIIGCLIAVGVIYVVWRFREEICQGIATVFRFIFRFFSWFYHRIAAAYAKSRENCKPED